MNGFFSHIVHKQTNPSANILPRLRGRFESFSGFQQSSINEVAEEKESVRPQSKKATQQEANELTNIPGDSPLKKTNPVMQDQIEESLSNEAALHPQPILSNTHKEQIAGTDFPDKKDNGLLVPGVPILQPDEKQFAKHQYNPDAHDDAPKLYNDAAESNSDVDQQQLFTWPQNVQLNPRLEVNMSVVNAFKELFKNENMDVHSTTQPSIIKVNIGRIDVRAVTQQQASKEPSRPKAGMSLDDFLKKKNGIN